MVEFIKGNPLPGSDSLLCEAKGLDLLRASVNGLRIPEVISITRDELKMERIVAETPAPADFGKLADGLARLHAVVGAQFGLESNNYIGLNVQNNELCANWGEFFVSRRLEFQLNLIRHARTKNSLSEMLATARSNIIDFLSAHQPKPSLLHGDLWSGNFLYSRGEFFLIDPAVYYGDRECDLAMTKMFGGFPREFYERYEKISPLPPGVDRRARIYNAYHYLNHYNLFGDSYLDAVVEAFESFNEL